MLLSVQTTCDDVVGCVLLSGFIDRAKIQKDRDFIGMTGQCLTQETAGDKKLLTCRLIG